MSVGPRRTVALCEHLLVGRCHRGVGAKLSVASTGEQKQIVGTRL